MSLICPKCEMEVEFDDDGMPEKRRPVRCGSCGESWFTGGKTDLYALSFAKPSVIDPEVARILKEEAALEMAARSVESEEQSISHMDDATKKEIEAKKKGPAQVGQDGYVSLNWRQKSVILLIGLLCALTALYLYAPNVAQTFPSLTDWVFSYVFLVNDGRQALSEILQSWDEFLIRLDIAGNAASAANWIVGTVQEIIDFGLGLVGSEEADGKG